MTNTSDPAAEFVEAMREHAAREATLVLPVGTLFILASSLQVVLRRPDFPEASRREVELWLGGVEEILTRLAPVFGRVLQMGTDPQHDVPGDAKEQVLRVQALAAGIDGGQLAALADDGEFAYRDVVLDVMSIRARLSFATPAELAVLESERLERSAP
ncbi:MAG TPA: hypothetical protein VGO11_19855 [Chthoniobacteraceae bacterium]|jgi:hypothetical protein|nr:hypothetical protein [Chthoniobacteraceae bacterium]